MIATPRTNLYRSTLHFRQKIIQDVKQDSHSDNLTVLSGWLLLIITYILFIGLMYAIFISKWMPDTGHSLLDAIKRDNYYCLLVPLTLPVSIIMVFVNWLGMKFFRHN